MAATSTAMEMGQALKSPLPTKRQSEEEAIEATKLRKRRKEEVVVGGTMGGDKLEDQMVSEVETGDGWKSQWLEKRLKRLERRVNKDRAKILKLQRAMGEIGIKGANTQDQTEVKSREGKAVARVGPKEELAGNQKRRLNLSPATIDYLANDPPQRYISIPDDELSMMPEAAQALEKEIRAVCERIYERDVDIQQQCLLKGYVEL